MKILVAFLVLVIALPLAYGASFDCTKAKTFVEKEICRDPLLSRLDEALSYNYNNMLSGNIGSGARKDLKATQRAWLLQRNKCTTRQCLIDAYRKRIDEICDYPVISGVHPDCIYSSEIE